MKFKYLIVSLLFVAFYSCTDESKFNNPAHHELTNGAFVSFADETMPLTYSDPLAINFNSILEDDNGNVSSYTIGMTAIVGGVTYLNDNFFTVTSFPAPISITSQSIADAIGIDVNEISFGDSFTWLATAVRNDGTVYYGLSGSYDEDTNTVGIGNTDSVLLTAATYRSAMNFNTIIACAAHIDEDMPGTWVVTVDAWNDYSIGDLVTVEAGPVGNTFHILNTTNPAPSNFATVIMIVTVDDSGNVTDITSNELYDYGVLIDPTDGGGGLVFSCVGVININVQWLTPDHTGTYGTYNFVLTKQ